jgi:hypothetical protein
LLERALAAASYSKKSLGAYPQIKGALQRPTLETLARHKGATRKMLEKQYQVKSKL